MSEETVGRKFEYKWSTNEEWLPIEFEDIRAGMFVRIFDDGERYTTETDNVWVATSKPFKDFVGTYMFNAIGVGMEEAICQKS